MVDGVPIVVQNCMTAHGGIVPMGVAGVVIDSAVPVDPVTMNIQKILFPQIGALNTLSAIASGNLASLNEAKSNIEKVKEEAFSNPILPKIDFSI